MQLARPLCIVGNKGFYFIFRHFRRVDVGASKLVARLRFFHLNLSRQVLCRVEPQKRYSFELAFGKQLKNSRPLARLHRYILRLHAYIEHIGGVHLLGLCVIRDKRKRSTVAL